MIRFQRWALSGTLDARQADDMTAEFRVTGLPSGYTWELLWGFGSHLDVLNLELSDGGDIGIVALNADNLAYAGIYTAQLRATTANGGIKHTDILELTIGASMTEDAQWPVIPHAFADYVENVGNEIATNIQNQVKPPFPVELGVTSYDQIAAARDAGRFVYGVGSAGDTYPLIRFSSLQGAVFGGLNPFTGSAAYWRCRLVNSETVWETASENYNKTDTIDESNRIPTAKAVHDALANIPTDAVVFTQSDITYEAVSEAVAEGKAVFLVASYEGSSQYPAVDSIVMSCFDDGSAFRFFSAPYEYLIGEPVLVYFAQLTEDRLYDVSTVELVTETRLTEYHETIAAALEQLRTEQSLLLLIYTGTEVVYIDHDTDSLVPIYADQLAPFFSTRTIAVVDVVDHVTNAFYTLNRVIGENDVSRSFVFTSVSVADGVERAITVGVDTVTYGERTLADVFVGNADTTYADYLAAVNADKAVATQGTTPSEPRIMWCAQSVTGPTNAITFVGINNGTLYTRTIDSSNTWTASSMRIPDAYTKAEIDTALGAYIEDVDTLLGEGDGTTSGKTLVPAVTAEDEGKVLAVADGAAVWQGEGKYTLIREMTVEEEIIYAVIDDMAETSLFIAIDVPVGVENKAGVLAINDNNVYYLSGTVRNDYSRRHRIELQCVGGKLRKYSGAAYNGTDGDSVVGYDQWQTYHHSEKLNFDNVNKVEFKLVGNVAIPIGTTMRLYAPREG